MAIKTEWISRPDGLSGYFAWPERAAPPLPAVIVVQEAWGVDAHIEDVTRRFAAAGYGALAPDLFAKGGVRPPALARDRMTELVAFVNQAPPTVFMDPQAMESALAAYSEAERARISESMAAMRAHVGSPDKMAAHVPPVAAAARYLRGERAETRGQKVAALGFCMGGGVAALLACHDPELAAAVIFYGSAPPPEAIGGIRCPVLGLYGGKDARITGGVPAFKDAMHAAGKRFEAHVFPNAGHAFFNDSRPSYDAAAAREAFVRTLSFLCDALTLPD